MAAAVAALAWWTGGDEPVPEWASGLLVPALGWLVLAVLFWRLICRLRG